MRCSFSRRSQFPIALPTAILALALTPSAQAQELPENSQRQIRALLAEKASRNPAQSKMDSHLVHAAQFLRGQPMNPDMPSLAGELEAVRPDANNFVEVDIRTDVTPGLLTLIGALGGTVVSAFPEYQSVRARLPLLSVERVAQRPEVRQIRVADRAYTNAAPAKPSQGRPGFAARGQAVRAQLAAFFAARKGADLPAPMLGSLLRSLSAAFIIGPDTPGDVAHKANIARSTFSIDGTGVKIGLLSDGVDSLLGEEAKGNLPFTVTVIPGQAGSGDEGAAMLEIVYTLAPGATLYYATGDGGQAQMAANIQALASAGCNIIVDDISYFAEAAFQDDIVARKVNAVTAAGVFYFSAAGNSGSNVAGTSGTWQGDFANSGFTYDGGATHCFVGAASNCTATYDTLTQASDVQIVGGGTGVYELMWSDPLGQSSNDYDLFITDSTGSVLDSSTNVQNGTQDPEEDITGSRRLGACNSGTCHIVVVKQPSAAARTLFLSTERGTLATATNSATYGHAAAASAFGIAATDARYAIPLYFPSCNGFSTTCNNGVEAYSSDGPRQMFFDADGTAVTPGNFLTATNGGIILAKPDFTAADGATTGLPASSGYNPFSGTSAAAPHAAAIAALMLQAAPTLTPAKMRAALAASTIDLVRPGTDVTNEGAGIVMAPAAVQAAITQGSGGTPLAITTSATLPSGSTGVAYVQNLTATGGTGAYTWTQTAGTLPPGLAISGSSLTGTPTSVGTYAFTLQVADTAGNTAFQPFTLTVVNGTSAGPGPRRRKPPSNPSR